MGYIKLLHYLKHEWFNWCVVRYINMKYDLIIFYLYQRYDLGWFWNVQGMTFTIQHKISIPDWLLFHFLDCTQRVVCPTNKMMLNYHIHNVSFSHIIIIRLTTMSCSSQQSICYGATLMLMMEVWIKTKVGGIINIFDGIWSLDSPQNIYNKIIQQFT